MMHATRCIGRSCDAARHTATTLRMPCATATPRPPHVRHTLTENCQRAATPVVCAACVCVSPRQVRGELLDEPARAALAAGGIVVAVEERAVLGHDEARAV